MKKYNILYRNEKLNQFPLSENDIIKIYGKNTISKKTINGNITIPINCCQIVELTII